MSVLLYCTNYSQDGIWFRHLSITNKKYLYVYSNNTQCKALLWCVCTTFRMTMFAFFLTIGQSFPLISPICAHVAWHSQATLDAWRRFVLLRHQHEWNSKLLCYFQKKVWLSISYFENKIHHVLWSWGLYKLPIYFNSLTRLAALVRWTLFICIKLYQKVWGITI